VDWSKLTQNWVRRRSFEQKVKKSAGFINPEQLPSYWLQQASPYAMKTVKWPPLLQTTSDRATGTPGIAPFRFFIRKGPVRTSNVLATLCFFLSFLVTLKPKANTTIWEATESRPFKLQEEGETNGWFFEGSHWERERYGLGWEMWLRIGFATVIGGADTAGSVARELLLLLLLLLFLLC
jgi:hypothetical protein